MQKLMVVHHLCSNDETWGRKEAGFIVVVLWAGRQVLGLWSVGAQAQGRVLCRALSSDLECAGGQQCRNILA